jgi:hypothetical protein
MLLFGRRKKIGIFARGLMKIHSILTLGSKTLITFAKTILFYS